MPQEVVNRQQSELRTIETLVVRPSEPIAGIAAAHAGELPRAMRWVLAG
jgi:hypothetical protein